MKRHQSPANEGKRPRTVSLPMDGILSKVCALAITCILVTAAGPTSVAAESEPASTPTPSDPADATSTKTRGTKDGERLVWTTMTSPAGREVRVLRPESSVGTTSNTGTGWSENSSDTAPGTASTQQNNPTASNLEGSASGRPATSDLSLGGSADSNPTSLRPARTSSASGDLQGTQSYFATGAPIPKIAAVGAYGGYPSTFGVQTVMPADGDLAFRLGITGFPKLGWLVTPGIEYRFGQNSSGYNTDGIYHFSNLFAGQTTNGRDRDHWGAESGFGYRWLLPDRRGVRWIAAVEMGGRWSNDSGLPKSPSLRAFWMIAAP